MIPVEAHGIGGLGGIVPLISAGTRKLEGAVESIAPGVNAHHWLQVGWKGALKQILANYKRTGQRPLVVLWGHSKGAQKVVFIARELHKAGLAVHYMAGIDPTALFPGEEKMTVPENVKFTDEFWSTVGVPLNWPLLNRKLFPGGGGGGKYVYPKAWGADRYKVHVMQGWGHIPVASAPFVQKRILTKIDEVLP
jgi:hypothetical protein